MKVAFIMLMPTVKIVGGYKVIYEYANYLSLNGYEVELIYSTMRGQNSRNVPKLVVHLVRKIIGLLGPSWFKLEKKVKRSVYKDFNSIKIKNTDVVVATAALTASYVDSLSNINKLYFIQDYEDWDISENELVATYQFPMKKIVISKWLFNEVSKYTNNSDIVYIPNGIDSNVFFVEKQLFKRENYTLSMLYHNDVRKGCDVSERIMYRLKEKYPQLKVYMFGSPKRKDVWPEWVHYVRNASPEDVRQQMNKSRVFLCTSRQEGFGLTGLESMFCGCILISTKCRGVLEYANNDNSILCDVDN